MAGSRAQQAAIAISMKKAGKVPKGYHKMPDGRIMKDSAHKMAKGGSAKSCWPGYEKKGTKKMYGKTYNNCVKK